MSIDPSQRGLQTIDGKEYFDGKEIYEWRVCNACERKFFITVQEKDYFENLGKEKRRTFQLPKRCWPCRQSGKRAPRAHERDEDHERDA